MKGFGFACPGRGYSAIGLCWLCCLVVGPVRGQETKAPQFTSFLIPGGGPSLAVTGMNDSGLIIGSYEVDTDQTVGTAGFALAADGTIIGVGPVRGGQVPTAVNDRGVITGAYYVDHDRAHGFIQYANGKVARFNVAGAGTGARFPRSSTGGRSLRDITSTTPPQPTASCGPVTEASRNSKRPEPGLGRMEALGPTVSTLPERWRGPITMLAESATATCATRVGR